MIFKKKEKTEGLEDNFRDSVIKSVEDGSFFKDSVDWHIFRYIGPFCDRSWLFFTAISGIIITYVLVSVIVSSFPIIEKVPIVLNSKDSTKYFPVIIALRDSKDLKTIEESIIKYLTIRYLKKREEFDFNKMSPRDLNNRFGIIKNNSSVSEYKNFQSIINPNNKNSPINNFNKNYTIKVKINSFRFIRDMNKDFFSRAKNFVYSEIPLKVEINFTLNLSEDDKQTNIDYLAIISYKFSRINNLNLDENIKFQVTEYKLYK